MKIGTEPAGRPRAFETIVYGGLAIGVLDAIDAMVFFSLYAGASPVRIWQSVAAGLLGREAAVGGGLATSALGLFLHFIISFLVAAVYYIGARNISFILRHPVASGLVFGVIANFVMQYIVIPLSAAPGSAVSRLGPVLNGVIGHAFLVGLPVALIASWSRNVRHARVRYLFRQLTFLFFSYLKNFRTKR